MLWVAEHVGHIRNTVADPVRVRSAVKSTSERRARNAQRGRNSMTLRPGDRFPEMTVRTTDGRQLTIPQELSGANKVILFYRGGW
jgi:hypothetical protein